MARQVSLSQRQFARNRVAVQLAVTSPSSWGMGAPEKRVWAALAGYLLYPPQRWMSQQVCSSTGSFALKEPIAIGCPGHVWGAACESQKVLMNLWGWISR